MSFVTKHHQLTAQLRLKFEIGGFCGGGGYGFSRTTLKKLIGNDTDKFLKEYKEHCDGTQFCDITTADLLVKRGIKLVNIKELRPWGIEKKDKDQIHRGLKINEKITNQNRKRGRMAVSIHKYNNK